MIDQLADSSFTQALKALRGEIDGMAAVLQHVARVFKSLGRDPTDVAVLDLLALALGRTTPDPDFVVAKGVVHALSPDLTDGADVLGRLDLEAVVGRVRKEQVRVLVDTMTEHFPALHWGQYGAAVLATRRW